MIFSGLVSKQASQRFFATSQFSRLSRAELSWTEA
jgi:hypothetical protein